MNGFDPWSVPLGGTSLIEASAGTGKTYTLTTLYLRLLVEENLLPSQILVVTYTQAATAELRDRVRERIREAIAMGAPTEDLREDEKQDAEREALRGLGRAARERAESGEGPDPLRRALAEFDEAAIFTIHGFCQRVLERNAFESGVAFDAELVAASGTIEDTLARDLFARGLVHEDPDFIRWLLVGRGKRWQFEPDALRHGILRALGADEEMPVEPTAAMIEGGADAGKDEGGERVSLSTLREQRDEALRAWASAWAADGTRVREWVLEGEDLSRQKYRVDTLTRDWLPFLEELALAWGASPSDSGEPAFEIPAWWSKWTPDALAKGVNKGRRALESPVFEAMARVEFASRAIDDAYETRALRLRRAFVDAARAAAKQRREEQHLLFFDDLLGELRAALRPPEGDRLVSLLREQYRFALIDEFQDTDPVQYEIFRRVWHESTLPASGLLLIGDPKQAIYSFRGADLFTYLRARDDAGDAVYSLAVNWRSDPGLIAALNRLWGRPARAFGIDAIEFDPVAPKPDAKPGLVIDGRAAPGLRVLLADREALSGVDASASGKGGKAAPAKPPAMPLREARTGLMRAFAQDVARLLESGATIEGRPIECSDIAVLARRKSQLVRAREALEALGIPCVDRGDQDVFESREAWELLCVLEAMTRSGDPARLRAALSTGAMGLGAGEIAALEDDSSELAEISERFAEYATLWTQFGFMRAFEAWRRREGVTHRLLGFADGDRRLTNWLHLAELLQRMESEFRISRAGLSGWLERAIADPDVRLPLGAEASLLRLERDDQAVCLMTLHRSKGLEFEVVYLPALWEKDESPGPTKASAAKGETQNPPVRCHDPEEGRRLLDLGGPRYATHVGMERAESESEQRRLLYVGLTRARRQCVVAWGVIQSSQNTALATLLHEPHAESEGLTPGDALDVRKAFSEEDWRRLWESIREARPEDRDAELPAVTSPGATAGLPADDILVVESADFGPRPAWQPTRAAQHRLAYRAPQRMLPGPRRTTSFSGLVQGAHRGIGVAMGPVAEGRDLDVGVETLHSFEWPSPSPSPSPSPGNAADASGLAGGMDRFPRGAQAGTLLHQVLEETCLSDWREDEARLLARNALAAAGLDSEYEDSILHVIESVARTPLREEPALLRLGDLPRAAYRPEMEFTLSALGGRSRFEPASLSDLLRAAGPDSVPGRYAERVRELGFRELQGYLRGFIDAVFFDGERYFLLDYKSNHLGTQQADYRPEKLVTPMIEHDYVLQYLIYSVALDRHLARTLDGYRYGSHFGGVYYLFLRGLAVSHEAGCGVFFDRPEESVVRALSSLLGEVA